MPVHCVRSSKYVPRFSPRCASVEILLRRNELITNDNYIYYYFFIISFLEMIEAVDLKLLEHQTEAWRG